MKCKICKIETKHKRSAEFFRHHVMKEHSLTTQQYYDKFEKKDEDGKCVCGKKTKFISYTSGYGSYCSTKCSANDPIKKQKWLESTGFKEFNQEEHEKAYTEKCLDCGHLIKPGGLGVHISQAHDFSSQQYYDTYLLKPVDGEGKCHCGKDAKFDNVYKGYKKYCSSKCAQTCPDARAKRSKQMKGRKFSESARKINEESGRWTRNLEKERVIAYRLLVDMETKLHKDKLFEDWNGKCFYTDVICETAKEKYNDDNYATIDHKISVVEGYQKKMNPFEIGHISNLVISTRLENIKKGKQSR